MGVPVGPEKGTERRSQGEGAGHEDQLFPNRSSTRPTGMERQMESWVLDVWCHLTSKHQLQGAARLEELTPAPWVVPTPRQLTAAPWQLHAVVSWLQCG